MSIARLNAIEAVTNYSIDPPEWRTSPVPAAELFGANVFGDREMAARLPPDVYRALRRTIDEGARLDVSLADAVAAAMRDWAIEKGATHYAHVFYPLTGLTAEKHDSFLSPDGRGGAVAEFSGKQLVMSESDASSFPSGGIRATFEARGYTAWDVTSPAYLLEHANGRTLCIPTAFCSWTGDALDKKTPLLRSLQAIDAQVRRLLRLFGDETPGRVSVTVGCEQEYFLVDRNFFFARPDLISAGRTLFGAKPPKGQEQEDQYFGAIPDRVLAFMLDVEHELYKLGVPVKTRHNEVAPGQYELAPVFESANVAADHQYLTMTVLQRVAQRYGMSCLLHEKPFAGINGSGKHLNWSISSASGKNLLDPGPAPDRNLRVLLLVSAVVQAVDLHAPLLRLSVAHAGNDHRLGANEAPPAIFSVFLGEPLSRILAEIARGDTAHTDRPGVLNAGVDTLPALPKDAGDRNRTSPFAFTGNKFEFRAVGSAQSVAGPLAVLNAIVADSLSDLAGQIERRLASGAPLPDAVRAVIADAIRAHGRVLFDGDGYTAAWAEEAARRGLPNAPSTPDAIDAAEDPSVSSVLARQSVLTPREFRARLDIAREQYVNDLLIEARLAFEIAKTKIYPAAVEYQSRLASTAVALQTLAKPFCTTVLDDLTALAARFQTQMADLSRALDAEPAAAPISDRSRYARSTLLPAMTALRATADALEGIVADDLWPLPTYQEMLFIK